MGLVISPMYENLSLYDLRPALHGVDGAGAGTSALSSSKSTNRFVFADASLETFFLGEIWISLPDGGGLEAEEPFDISSWNLAASLRFFCHARASSAFTPPLA